MPIAFLKKRARLTELVSVEDAESLLEWLQKTPKGGIDLSRCSHLHAANLQVLMAARPPVLAWPEDAALAAWLRRALMTHE